MESFEEMRQRLIERLQTDPDFQERMRQDPEGTARAEDFVIPFTEIGKFLGESIQADIERTLSQRCEPGPDVVRVQREATPKCAER